MGKKTHEDEFEEIATKASEDAAHVECTAKEYRAGLRSIIERLQLDHEASRTPEERAEDEDEIA